MINDKTTSKTFIDKTRGMFVGLAIGDTLGMAVEFKERGTFEPLTEPIAGGPFHLPLGYWTDDTSMALCLADSLLEKEGYDSYDVMEKYRQWRDEGYRSSVGSCFDIGNQVSGAIYEFAHSASPVISIEKHRSTSAGNGSIMRLAPIVIASAGAGNTIEQTMVLARISARETHYSEEAEEGTALFAALLYNALQCSESNEKEQLFSFGSYKKSEVFNQLVEKLNIAESHTPETIDPTGYIVDSLLATIWAFMNYSTFEDGALAAVNLGGDADTIGAIYGQLAGAYYGYSAIPDSWKDILYQKTIMVTLSDELAQMKSCEAIITRFEEDGDSYVTQGTIEVKQGNIAEAETDIIVNAANTELFGGSGVSGAIFDGAGYDSMTNACKEIGSCDYGEAVITPGFNLPAKQVIHTVGPVYGQHNGNEADILRSCYWQSLRLAQVNRARTIAFPLISTGIYGYPKEEAAKIAIQSIREFFEDNKHTSIQKVFIRTHEEADSNLVNRCLR